MSDNSQDLATKLDIVTQRIDNLSEQILNLRSDLTIAMAALQNETENVKKKPMQTSRPYKNKPFGWFISSRYTEHSSEVKQRKQQISPRYTVS